MSCCVGCVNSMAGAEANSVDIGSKLRSRRALVSFIISFMLIYVLSTMVDVKETLLIIRSADLGYLFIAFFVYYLSIPIRGYRWQIFLQNVNIGCKLMDVTKIWFIAYFVNCLVPAKLGDIYRGYLVHKKYNVRTSKVLGTIVVERVFDVTFLMIVLSLGGYAVFGSVLPSEIFRIIVYGYAIIVVALAFLVFLNQRKETVVSFLPSRVESIVLGFMSGVSKSVRVKGFSRVLVLTALGWAAEIFRFYFVVAALGLSVPLSLIVFIALLVSILSSIPLTPSGFGVIEFAVGSILVFFGYGIEISASVAILDRLINTLSFLVIGPLVYFKSELK